MICLKRLAMLMLSLSIAFAGFPAQAMMECPMGKMQKQMSVSDMKMDDCAGMTGGMQTEKAKQEKKGGGCCDDIACTSKCMAACSAGHLFLAPVSVMNLLSVSEKHRYATDKVLISNLPSSQDRPPKFLS